MNIISEEKFELAYELALQGKSIREIAKGAGIAKQTAQDIQQARRMIIEDETGCESPKVMGGFWDHRKHKEFTVFEFDKVLEAL